MSINSRYSFWWGVKTYSRVDTVISLVIIAVLSLNTPLWKKPRVCMCACASVCARLIIFPLHALLSDNLITTFSDTLTSRSKIALRNVAHFLSGCWFMGCLCRMIFSSFLFFQLSVFFPTVSGIVSHLRRQCHREEEREMNGGGREDGESLSWDKKNEGSS